jgi:hypothetical protein
MVTSPFRYTAAHPGDGRQIETAAGWIRSGAPSRDMMENKARRIPSSGPGRMMSARSARSAGRTGTAFTYRLRKATIPFPRNLCM